MATHDYIISNASGAAVRADLNNALAAIVSNNSSATAPTTTYAYQWWADIGSTPNVMKLRNSANSAWITLFQLDGEYTTIPLENGTAAAPSIYFKDSGTDTGLFSGGTDQVNVSTGGVERVEWGTSEVVFNDGGVNYDFRVEGDTNANLLFVDASADAVGIGTTSPEYTFDARGSINVSGSIFRRSADNTTFSVINRAAQALIFGTDDLEKARIDSSGRLLVGTSTSLDSASSIQTSKTSGSNTIRTNSDSLANDEVVRFAATGSVSGVARESGLGVYKHSGITNACSYVRLEEEDGTTTFTWVDNSDQLRISTNAAHIGTTSGTVVGTQTSDERIKNVLGPVEYGLETVKQIESVRYALKSEPNVEKLGFIAQQVQPLVPQSIFDTNEHIEGEPEDAPTKLGMEYVALIPVLVNAIKELSAEVDALKAQLQTQ